MARRQERWGPCLSLNSVATFRHSFVDVLRKSNSAAEMERSFIVRTSVAFFNWLYWDMLGIEASTQNWINAWATFDIGEVQFALHAIPAGIAKNIEIACPPVPRLGSSMPEMRSPSSTRSRMLAMSPRGFRSWIAANSAIDQLI
jgi:hypothetical protein